MFAEELICKAVKNSPKIDNIISEFEAGMKMTKSVEILRKQWKAFLQILHSQGGAARIAAQCLAKEWEKAENNVKSVKEKQKHHPISNPSTNLEKISVTLDDPVAEDLAKLYNEFVDLVTNIKNTLRKLITNGKDTLIGIAEYLGEYFRITGLTHAIDIQTLFEGLWSHYNYLNCNVLEKIIEHYQLDELKGDMFAYKQHLEEFKQSTTLDKFKKAVKEALIPNPEATATTCEVIIKINDRWRNTPLKTFEALVNHFFHERMNHIRVEPGSICVILLVPRSRLDYILKRAKLMKEFAKLVGIFELTIDAGQPIVQEKEEKQFSFDKALEESSKVGNVEAMQFLQDIIKKEIDLCAKELDYYTSPEVFWEQSLEDETKEKVEMLISGSASSTFQGKLYCHDLKMCTIS